MAIEQEFKVEETYVTRSFLVTKKDGTEYYATQNHDLNLEVEYITVAKLGIQTEEPEKLDIDVGEQEKSEIQKAILDYIEQKENQDA